MPVLSSRKSAVSRTGFSVCSHRSDLTIIDCGDAFSNGGTNTTATDCDMACTGDSNEICGGPGTFFTTLLLRKGLT